MNLFLQKKLVHKGPGRASQGASTPSITSTELNYLVFRYLQESGFTHSAFTLGYEARINKCTIDGHMVPSGALVRFVQKGLQYLEMEANISNNDVEEDEVFSFLQPMDIITKDVNELQKMVTEREKIQLKEVDKNQDIGKKPEIERSQVREKARHEREKEYDKDKERLQKHKEREKQQEEPRNRENIAHQEGKASAKHVENGNSEGPESMDFTIISSSQKHEFIASDVTILEGHTSEVCACAWNPTAPLLASASGDSTARIWKISDGPKGVLVLKHIQEKTSEKSQDVTTLDWNSEGTLLATGSYDGQARIWNTNGDLKCTLNKHKGPIFSLKWNKKGDYLLTGSCDKSAIVWDVKSEEWKQEFGFHKGPTLDVDWRNNISFATGSVDTMIYVCKIGENHPLKAFAGHRGEVNCVKWDPTGTLLASCSDDATAKIWSMKQDKYVHDFREHTKEIYTIRWSPTGAGTSNPNHPVLLASASFDSTIKLWDVDQGKLIRSLNGHREPVYSLAFSPDGQFLASGSLDRCLHIWSLKEGKIVKTYTGDGGSIFEVCWTKEGDKIAACFANNILCVLDLRKGVFQSLT